MIVFNQQQVIYLHIYIYQQYCDLCMTQVYQVDCYELDQNQVSQNNHIL